MLALLRCAASGRPLAVSAPSLVCAETGSPPLPTPAALTCWKFPAASVKPIGAACRWSWNLLTKKNTCVASCARFVRQEKRLLWFHEQPDGGQFPLPGLNG